MLCSLCSFQEAKEILLYGKILVSINQIYEKFYFIEIWIVRFYISNILPIMNTMIIRSRVRVGIARLFQQTALIRNRLLYLSKKAFNRLSDTVWLNVLCNFSDNWHLSIQPCHSLLKWIINFFVLKHECTSDGGRIISQ